MKLGHIAKNEPKTHYQLKMAFFVIETSPHISPENRNYSATDPKNSETSPQANLQFYVVFE